MKKYSPGANINSDFYHVCDYCEMDDGRPVLCFDKLPERKGHFALCHACIAILYMNYDPTAFKGI